MTFHSRLGVAASILSFGATKLIAQLWLAAWELGTAGHPDITARKVWILAGLLPGIALGGVALTVLSAWALTRHTGRPLLARVGPALLGGGVAAILIIVGADPTLIILDRVRWSSALQYHAVSSSIAFAAVLAGLVLVGRSSRATVPARAAA